MSGHPDVEALAAYAAGDLVPSESIALAEHVVGCAACASDLAAIRAVGADLAALPPLTMPDDVAASLDAALAAERESAPAAERAAPVSLDSHRRRRSLAPLLTGAAACALLGAIGYGLFAGSGPAGNDSAGSGTAMESTQGPPAGTRYYSSGYAYDQANVEEGALRLLAGDASKLRDTDAVAAPTPSPSGPGPTGFTSGGQATVAARTAVDPPALERCVRLLTEGANTVPVAVDYAMFEGQPAVVIVLPFREGQYDVFVVTRRCGSAGDDATLLHFQRVSA